MMNFASKTKMQERGPRQACLTLWVPSHQHAWQSISQPVNVEERTQSPSTAARQQYSISFLKLVVSSKLIDHRCENQVPCKVQAFFAVVLLDVCIKIVVFNRNSSFLIQIHHC